MSREYTLYNNENISQDRNNNRNYHINNYNQINNTYPNSPNNSYSNLSNNTYSNNGYSNNNANSSNMSTYSNNNYNLNSNNHYNNANSNNKNTSTNPSNHKNTYSSINNNHSILNDKQPLPNNYMVNLSPFPEHTKMTRCNNNLREDNNRIDFLRPIISNQSIPIVSDHEHYLYDSNINECNYMNQFDIERASISTRNENSNSRKPVQSTIQTNYYSTNFETLNNSIDNDANKYLTRNPVNTRRDNLEKERNNDKNDFLKYQGGMLNGNYSDLRVESTRKNRNDINSSSYVPMARTLAIPKENI